MISASSNETYLSVVLLTAHDQVLFGALSFPLCCLRSATKNRPLHRRRWYSHDAARASGCVWCLPHWPTERRGAQEMLELQSRPVHVQRRALREVPPRHLRARGVEGRLLQLHGGLLCVEHHRRRHQCHAVQQLRRGHVLSAQLYQVYFVRCWHVLSPERPNLHALPRGFLHS